MCHESGAGRTRPERGRNPRRPDGDRRLGATRDGVVTLWQRARPERADAVAVELTSTREDLDSDSSAEGELAAEWQGRIRRLLTERPQVAEELRQLLDELVPGALTAAAPVVQRASADGHSRIYQAGRDQHITE
ncbi:hypothetical protein [Streptomyces sp. NPDC006863]|uniref:hypothetical protein n=1 Tax=unclassified Streptomyces TaxID=2593676 RepID=UPI0033C84322